MAMMKTREKEQMLTCIAESGTFVHFLWEYKLLQPQRKPVWRFPHKLDIDLQQSSSSPLGHIPKGLYPTTEILAHPSSQLLYLQQPGNGNSLDVD